MAASDPVALRNSRPFVQLMTLLEAHGLVRMDRERHIPVILDRTRFENFGFATFIASVAEARWRRRGLFALAPYGTGTLFAVAEPSIRARFVVSTGAPEHGVTRLYPGAGAPPPSSHECALRAYFSFNWSVVRKEPPPFPQTCKGGEGCAKRCATEEWFRSAPLSGEEAAACIGGLGTLIDVPYAVLAPIYEQLPPEEDIEIDPSMVRDARDLKMYGFDAYVAILLAAELGAEAFCPNTHLTHPFPTAELDAAAFRRDPPRLAVVETTVTSEEPMPGDESANQKPLDRLKTKWLQRIGISGIPGVTTRYIYACIGKFTYPSEAEWGALLAHHEQQEGEKLHVLRAGERDAILSDMAEGRFDAEAIRRAFDELMNGVVAAAKG